MTDTKLNPATLSAEERAFVDLLAAQRRRDGFPDDKCHEYAFEDARCMILARRALFEPAPEKVVCPNCLRETETTFQHEIRLPAGYSPEYACQPEQPEPAAPDISELDDRHNRMASPEYQAKVRADMDRKVVEIGMDRLVGTAYYPVSETVTVGAWQLEELLKYADLAEVALRTGFHPPEFIFAPADRSLRQCIDAIKEERDKWRTHSQPVAVGMTDASEKILQAYDAANDLLARYLPPDSGISDREVVNGMLGIFDNKTQIDAREVVRQQAAQGQRPKLEKVREYLEMMEHRFNSGKLIHVIGEEMLRAALAELDAVEGGK